MQACNHDATRSRDFSTHPAQPEHERLYVDVTCVSDFSPFGAQQGTGVIGITLGITWGRV